MLEVKWLAVAGMQKLHAVVGESYFSLCGRCVGINWKETNKGLDKCATCKKIAVKTEERFEHLRKRLEENA